MTRRRRGRVPAARGPPARVPQPDARLRLPVPPPAARVHRPRERDDAAAHRARGRRPRRGARPQALLDELGLADRAHHRPGALSGRRAAAGGGGPRPGRSRPARSWPTSPPATSTRRPATACTASCGVSTRRRGSPSSWSPTTSAWPRPATASLRLEGGRLHDLSTAEWADRVLRLESCEAAAAAFRARESIEHDVRALYRAGPAGHLLRPLRSQPARQQLDRDRAPAAGPDPGGQGPDLAHLQQEPPLHGVDPQGDRGPRALPRQGLDLGGHPALARRASASSATPPRRRSGCSTTTSAPSTSCSG